MCVAGVQEGSWPDLRRRGSLLGSEQLVDVLAGRDGAGVSTGRAAAGRGAAAVLRRGHPRASRLLVSRRCRARRTSRRGSSTSWIRAAGDRVRSPPAAACTFPALVAELRAAVSDPSGSTPGGRRRGRAGPARAAPACGAPTRTSGGGWPRCPTRAGSGPGGPGAGHPVAHRVLPRCELRWLLEAARRPRRRRRPRIARHADPRGRGGRADDADLGELGPARRLAGPARLRRPGSPSMSGPGPEPCSAKLVAWLRDTRPDLTMIARGTGLRRRRSATPGFAAGSTGWSAIGRAGSSSSTSRPASPSRRPRSSRVHPQLGAYQLAVQAGGFAESPLSVPTGGARLVQLGRAVKSYEDQQQPPLGEQDDPSWIARHVAYVADTMRGGRFRRDRELLLRHVRDEDQLPADGRRPTGDPMTISARASLAELFGSPRADRRAGGGDRGAAARRAS